MCVLFSSNCPRVYVFFFLYVFFVCLLYECWTIGRNIDKLLILLTDLCPFRVDIVMDGSNDWTFLKKLNRPEVKIMAKDENWDNDLTKAIFWKLTDEIFGDGFFDNADVTKEEIRNKFYSKMKEDFRLRKSPVYAYWMHRTMFDMFESEQDGGSVVVH